MKYTCEITIHKNRDWVTKNYIDKDQMPLWEKGLTKIEEVKGQLFDTDSEGYLIFMFGKQEMKMKVSVEKNALPDQIIQIYEVPGAWNRCDNYFYEIGEHTKWVMDVTFLFDEKTNIPEERFFEKTKAGMQIFKDFIEGMSKA